MCPMWERIPLMFHILLGTNFWNILIIYVKESTKIFDLSWLISKVCAYWFSLISITISEKWVILFTMHNFVLNVTNNCYEVVIKLFRRQSFATYYTASPVSRQWRFCWLLKVLLAIQHKTGNFWQILWVETK